MVYSSERLSISGLILCRKGYSPGIGLDVDFVHVRYYSRPIFKLGLSITLMG